MNRTFLHGPLGAIRRWHDRRRVMHALSALDDRLLRDIGIDRNQVICVVEDRMNGAASEADGQGQTPLPAESQTPWARPYPARPAGIHGPAARHWPQAFQRAKGANDGAAPGEAMKQTC